MANKADSDSNSDLQSRVKEYDLVLSKTKLLQFNSPETWNDAKLNKRGGPEQWAALTNVAFDMVE